WTLAPGAPDLVAISPTGSGKTLAFLVPALSHLLGEQVHYAAGCGAPAQPSVLVLAPTRELCQQTATSAERIIAAICADARAADAAPAAALAMACVYGGVDYHRQRAALLAAEGQPRLLVATPGRLLSL
ncbi:P-loop containing nucleoside triphosphate hydrolase protein, partial [Pavlovales sp. CCMP2436]